MSDTSDRVERLETQTDQGAPVGNADAQADVDRASAERHEEPDIDEFLQQGSVEMSRDQGEAVGNRKPLVDDALAGEGGDDGDAAALPVPSRDTPGASTPSEVV